MKWLVYQISNRANIGTEEKPEWHEILIDKKISYSEASL
jgi:hypothetical protein